MLKSHLSTRSGTPSPADNIAAAQKLQLAEANLAAMTAARDKALEAVKAANGERDAAKAVQAAAETARDAAIAAQAAAEVERDAAKTEQAAAEAERDKAKVEAAKTAAEVTDERVAAKLAIAAAAAGVPLAEVPPSAGASGDNDVDALRAELAVCTDPSERFKISAKIRALRNAA